MALGHWLTPVLRLSHKMNQKPMYTFRQFGALRTRLFCFVASAGPASRPGRLSKAAVTASQNQHPTAGSFKFL